MKYEPKKIGKKAENISLVLFFAAIVLVYLANAVVEAMRWIAQLGAIALLGIFIYIIVRWCFTDFMYEIKARSKMETVPFSEIPGERLQFYVHRKQGKRGYAAEFLCNVGDIQSIEPVSETSPNTGKRYFFYRNMKKANRYVMTVCGEKEPLLVFLEIGEDGKDFLEFINSKKAG